MKFQRETPDIFEEMIPLFKDHHQEISEFPDFNLSPNIEIYRELEEKQALRLFTARDDDNKLVGYALFFVFMHPHFENILQARADILYIQPEERGFGLSFLKYCDEELQKDRVKVVYHTVTERKDFSPILKRLGYGLSEQLYSRRF